MKWFAIVWVVAQITLPLSYYLGWRGADERFAWRMFSPHVLDAERCKLRVREVKTDGSSAFVDPLLHIHSSFVRQMLQGDHLISQKYLAWRCTRDAQLERLELEHRCTAPESEYHASEPCQK